MKFSKEGEALLKTIEGLLKEPFTDHTGHKFIGYGHKLMPGESYHRITKGTAELMLQEDVSHLENLINNYIPVRMNQNQFDALVIFIYNVGRSAFLNSKMFKDLKACDLDSALEEWENWTKESTENPSLARRRKHELELFRRKNDNR